VRWKNKIPFDSLFSWQHSCQKLSKLVDACWSYSKPKQCRFFDTQCTIKIHWITARNSVLPCVEAVFAADMLCDLVNLTFWLWTRIIHGMSCGQPSTKFEDPFLIHSWVVSYDIIHQLLWTDNAFGATAHALYHLCVWGKFFPHIKNLWPWFVYLLCNLHGSVIKINWVLCQDSILPCVIGHRNVITYARSCNLSPGINWPQNGGFEGKNEVEFWLQDPKKAHPCTEPRLLAYFPSKSA